MNGRISYLESCATFRGAIAKYVRERYIRDAAIIIAAIEGSKNNCVKETHEKPVASAISSTRKDVPS